MQMAKAEAPKLEQMAQKDMTGAGGAATGAGTSAAATPAGVSPGAMFLGNMLIAVHVAELHAFAGVR